MRSERAQLQAEFERTRDERDRLARELGNIKRETEETWASERVENALLRERINDVAAEVARLASALEGPNSPIDAILAAETVRDRYRQWLSATARSTSLLPRAMEMATVPETSPTAFARCRRMRRGLSRTNRTNHQFTTGYKRPA